MPGLILAGRASDRWGRRALVLPASAVALVGCGILAFGMRGFAVLLMGRLVYGLGMGAVMSPGSVWLQELSPPGSGPAAGDAGAVGGLRPGPVVLGAIAELAPAPTVPSSVRAGQAAGRWPAYATCPRLRSARARGTDAARAPRSAALLELLPIAPWAFGVMSLPLAILPGSMRRLGAARAVLGIRIFVALAAGVLVSPSYGRSATYAGLWDWPSPRWASCWGPRGDRRVTGAGVRGRAAGRLLATAW